MIWGFKKGRLKIVQRGRSLICEILKYKSAFSPATVIFEK